MSEITYAVLEALACGRPGCACARAIRRGYGLTHCPAHDDRTPSLSVDPKGGKLLWNCKSGCSQEAVLGELQHRGLLHEVRDHTGRVVARHERKGRWFQPDGRIGLNGTSSKELLYGLERIPGAAPGRAVIVVEGEKAAGALHRLDVLAVGTTCGAASTPSPDVLAHLRGRPVVLWPDSDDPGRQHMVRIAEVLARLGAQVLTIEWAQAPEHGDAADYVDQLGELTDEEKRARVLDFLRSARPAGAQAGNTLPAGWQRIDLGPYLRGEVNEPDPALLPRADGQHLLYPRKVHWISGEPEGGKTWFALIPVADALAASGTAVYVDFEGDPSAIVERLLALGVQADDIARGLSYHRPEVPMTEAARAHILQCCAELQPAVTVIDGVQAAMGLGGLNSNDQKDFYAWWDAFGQPLRKATPGALCCIDHVVKDPNARAQFAAGTMQKQAALDVHFGIEVIDQFGIGLTGRMRLMLHKDKAGRLRQRQAKDKCIGTMVLASNADTMQVRFCIEPPGERPAARAFRPTVLMERISRHLELASEPQSKAAIRAAVAGKDKGKIAAIDVLHEEGYLTGSTRRGNTVYASANPYRAEEESDVASLDATAGWPLRQAGNRLPVPLFPGCSPGVPGTGQEEGVPPVPGCSPTTPFTGVVHGNRGNTSDGPSEAAATDEVFPCPSCGGPTVQLTGRRWCPACERDIQTSSRPVLLSAEVDG